MTATTSKAPRRAGFIPALATSLVALWAVGIGAVQAEPLTIALSSAVNTLDPTQAQVVGTDVSMAAHFYSPLVERGPDGKLTGVIAESWSAENDETWVFNLRAGVTFPGGEPLDAEVVKWNIDRIRDPETASRNLSWFKPVTDVEVVSPTQIKIHTDGAYPTLPDQLSMIFFLSPTWMETHNPAVEVYGTGPYALKEFRSGDSIVMEPNPSYFGEAPPFDLVTFRMITEPAARVAGIMAGELDLAFDLPLEEVDRIEQSGAASAAWIASTRSMIVRMNDKKPPLGDNVQLRQALNYAIDKQAIVDGLLGGLGEVSDCQIMTPAYFGYNPDLQPYAYDPEKARELIAASGVAGPIDIELQVPLGRYFMASEIGQVVAGQLQEVGINATLSEGDFSSWVQPYSAGDMGQLALMGQAWPTLDADGMLGLYSSANVTGYFNNDDFDAALAEGRGTTNPDARLAAYKTATEIMCEQAPVIFLFAQPLTYANSDRITWSARGDDWVRVTDITLN